MNKQIEEMRSIANTLRDLLVQQQLTYTREGVTYVRADGFILCAQLLGISVRIVSAEPIELEGGTHFMVKAVATFGELQNEGYALCGPTDPGHEDGIHSRALALAQTRALARAIRPLVTPYIVLTNLSATIAEELPLLERLMRYEDATPSPPSQPSQPNQPSQGRRRTQNYPSALNLLSDEEKERAISIWLDAVRKLPNDELQRTKELIENAQTAQSVKAILTAAYRRLHTVSS